MEERSPDADLVALVQVERVGLIPDQVDGTGDLQLSHPEEEEGAPGEGEGQRGETNVGDQFGHGG